MKKFGFPLAILLLSAYAIGSTIPSGFHDVKVVGGLIQPVACEFAPDGRLFILSKSGRIYIVRDNQQSAQLALTLPVNSAGERGLLGMALDPDFRDNNFLYVYYTSSSTPPVNRVSRFTVRGNLINSSSQRVLLDQIRSDSVYHNAGCLRFGPDGKLYISTGDTYVQRQLAQDLNNLNGKILRINSDGTVPLDNPFAGQLNRRGEIWCYGLRNPWRFNFDVIRKTMFIADVGSAFDEINIGRRGGNYGWPEVEGNSGNPSFINPIHAYTFGNQGNSITGGLLYRGSNFPEQYRGLYFFGDYVQQFIRTVKLTSGNQVSSVNDFATNIGQIVHITIGPDGALYYATLDGQIRKIIYRSGSNRPPVPVIRANRNYGGLPLTVSFSASSSTDPDGDRLQYLWDFGDGASASEVQITHTYRFAQNFRARLTVTDSRGASASKTYLIYAGDRPPVPVIHQPRNGLVVRPGQTVRFSGSSSDPDESTIDASRFVWNIVLHHNEHTHPFLGPLPAVSDGSLDVPVHESGNVFLRIILKVKDNRGLSAVSYADLILQ